MKKMMKQFRVSVAIAMAAIMLMFGFNTAQAASEADVARLVDEASKLTDLKALAFFQSLDQKGLTNDQVIQFFLDLPLSTANKAIHDMYLNEGMDSFAKAYPDGDFYGGYEWKPGMGTDIVGTGSGNALKLPYSDEYVPVPKGPIGDPQKTYNIGVLSCGLQDVWIANMQDSVEYEALRHPNINLVNMDYGFDMNKFSSQMDTLIARGVDAIVTWPMIEAMGGPPVQRAEEAGIPVVTVNRNVLYDKVSGRVSGNFPANGAQMGAYLVWQLAQETKSAQIAGKVVLLRKPAGSTADTIRTGYFLKVLSYFPGITILQSYHDQDNREESLVNIQNALQAHPEIDAVFCGDSNKAAVAVNAITQENRMNSRAGGKQILVMAMDDSKEVFYMMERGEIVMDTPYTPMLGDIATRVAIKLIEGVDMPQDVAIPNIFMVTKNGDNIFGIKTQSIADWTPYVFGPPYTAAE